MPYLGGFFGSRNTTLRGASRIKIQIYIFLYNLGNLLTEVLAYVFRIKAKQITFFYPHFVDACHLYFDHVFFFLVSSYGFSFFDEIEDEFWLGIFYNDYVSLATN